MSPGKAWEGFLTDRDREVFAAAGYGQHMGFGERPAVVVVDVTYNFCGDRREPILESIRRWPNSCGESAWDAVAKIGDLLAAARAKRLPVIYTTGGFRADGWDYGSWKWKYGRAKDEYAAPPSNRRGNDIVDEIAPGDMASVEAAAKLEGELDKGGFAAPVADFYLTNPIARASAVMAECSALARTGFKQAAE